MYYCFCGPPSARAIFVSRFGIDLLREVLGDFQFVYANTRGELIEILKDRNGRRCMLYFDFPDASISRIVMQEGIPTALTTEPFENIVGYAMAAWNMDLLSAIRFATRSVAALSPIAKLHHINPLRLEGRDQTLTWLANTLALSLGMELRDGAIERLSALYADGPSLRVDDLVRTRVEFVDQAAQKIEALKPDERMLVDTIGSGYQAFIDGKPSKSIIWPGAICLSADRQNQGMTHSVEMTGPARILSYGPYLHLPVGDWWAEMRFHVGANWSENQMMMEITSGSDILASGQANLPPVGIFSLGLPFKVSACEQTLEIRSTMMKGAIEGEFRLLDIVVTPRDAEGGSALRSIEAASN